MSARGHLALLLSVTILGLAGAARGQDVQRYHPGVARHDAGYLGVPGAQLLKEREWILSLQGTYADRPLVRRADDGSVQRSLVGGLYGFDLGFAYGLYDRLELSAAVPFARVSGDLLKARGDEGWGLGDVRLGARLRAAGRRDSPWALTLGVPLILPTGDTTRYIGGSGVGAGLRAIGEAHTRWISVSANIGYLWRSSTDTVGNIDIGSEIPYGLGLSAAPGVEALRLIAELAGALPGEPVVDSSTTQPLEARLGLRYHTPLGLVLTVGAGVGIIPDGGTPAQRWLFGVGWQRPGDPPPPPIVDSDDDGLLDDVDACVTEAEDVDGFLDADGCPDPDNDRDGFPDAQDQCPNRAEVLNGIEDGDGCPDGDRDSDGDGIPNEKDPCPDEAEDRDDFEDDDGCPDPDNDHDGHLDVHDRCPNDAETVNGFEDHDGCPDLALVELGEDAIRLLRPIRFVTSSARLLPEDRRVIEQVARLLRAQDEIELVLVEAHTGRVGDQSVNMQLSRARAAAVTEALVAQGIDRARLAPSGYGGTRPIEIEDDARNYRVEFKISSRSARPNSVERCEVQPTESSIDVVLQSSRPLDASKVTAFSDGDQVVWVRVPGLDAAEEQLVVRDPQVVRAFILPDAELSSGAIVRVRFLNPVAKDLPSRVRVMVTGNRFRVSFPRR